MDRDAYFVSGGVRLRCRDRGSGPAIVFVHGWTLDLEIWNPQAEALAGTLRVVRFDRRGFGLSGGVPSLEADLADLAALLDHLGLERVALAGASQGARVALGFALGHPERIDGLVLDGPPDEFGDGAAEAASSGGDEEFSYSTFAGITRAQGLAAFRRAWQEHPFMRLRSADAEARALLAAVLERYPGRDLLQDTAPPAPRRDAADLARLAVPALVINGQLDTSPRLRAGQRLARALPDAERVIVAGAGHLPNLDRPYAYNQAIATFLRRRTRAAA